MRYLPNKRDALQAHMHKVHKLGNCNFHVHAILERIHDHQPLLKSPESLPPLVLQTWNNPS